jgi:acyl carrier protein
MALTEQAIREFLGEKVSIDSDSVGLEDSLFVSGMLDSFTMVDLVLFIETAIGRRMARSEVNLDNLDSIARMLAYAKADD